MEQLTWHQQEAIHAAYRLRNYSAHILAADYIRTGKTLCGRTDPKVWIDADKRHNPANLCCRRCLIAAQSSYPPSQPIFSQSQSALNLAELNPVKPHAIL